MPVAAAFPNVHIDVGNVCNIVISLAELHPPQHLHIFFCPTLRELGCFGQCIKCDITLTLAPVAQFSARKIETGVCAQACLLLALAIINRCRRAVSPSHCSVRKNMRNDIPFAPKLLTDHGECAKWQLQQINFNRVALT